MKLLCRSWCWKSTKDLNDFSLGHSFFFWCPGLLFVILSFALPSSSGHRVHVELTLPQFSAPLLPCRHSWQRLLSLCLKLLSRQLGLKQHDLTHQFSPANTLCVYIRTAVCVVLYIQYTCMSWIWEVAHSWDSLLKRDLQRQWLCLYLGKYHLTLTFVKLVCCCRLFFFAVLFVLSEVVWAEICDGQSRSERVDRQS